MPTSYETRLDLILSRAPHDRVGLKRRDPDLLPTLLADDRTRVFDLFGDRVLLDGAELAMRPPKPSDRDALAIYLGQLDGAEHVVVVHHRDEAPEESRSLRTAGMVLDDTRISLVTAAVGMANWHATQGFCPRCGARTTVVESGWVRRCEADGTDQYPRTDPAVIMSVVDDDDRLLLARNAARHGSTMMSVLAGFVEPGESFEAAVAREVMEEVGVPVTETTFVGNQPWPFPASLMIGYTARAAHTGLQIDPEEIDTARWFGREQFGAALYSGELTVPPRLSIARHLIEAWYGGPVDHLWKA